MQLSLSSRKRIAKDIVYEIMMFNGTSVKLLAGLDNGFEKNVLVESFALHCRNLFEFFYAKKRLKDNLLAFDFILKKKKFFSERTRKRQLENLTNKTNKQVAHLTYSRNNYNRSTKGWKVSVISENMNRTIVAFLSCLEPDEKVWFIDAYEKYGLKMQ